MPKYIPIFRLDVIPMYSREYKTLEKHAFQAQAIEKAQRLRDVAGLHARVVDEKTGAVLFTTQEN